MKYITLSFKRMTWPVLGAVFLLAFGATNAAQAKWQAYFLGSTATTCEEMYVEMDSQFGTGYSGHVEADIQVKGIESGEYADSYPSPTQWASVEVSPDRTSFTWYETTSETGYPNAGFNMVCVKAGNGRTCWHTQFDKETAPTQVFSDLNTTSKIGNAWICSDSASLPATGGPDCPSYSGESLYQLFEGVQSPEALITVYDGASVETCAAPAPEPTTTEVTRTIRQCNDANSFAPIGSGTDPDICDPTDSSQNCCRVDDVCISQLADPTNLGQIIANCTNNVGGPPASNGYAKGGDHSCFYSYSSGSGGISMVCY